VFGRNDILVPAFHCDVQRRPTPVKSEFPFGILAQYFSNLIDVAGLDRPAKFPGVDHSSET
jgi:hypothetical protein